MGKKYLLKALNDSFKRINFIKGSNNHWLLQLSDVVIVFKLRFSSWSAHFYLDFGCIYTKLTKKTYVKDYIITNQHFGHELQSILLKKNDIPENLFTYSDTEEEVERNVNKLFFLITEQMVPLFSKFNDYDYMFQNFKKNIAFKPYFVYYEIPEY